MEISHWITSLANFISNADHKTFLWLNQWAGNLTHVDKLVQLLVSDYLIPVAFSVTLVGLWFGWRGDRMRDKHQRAVMTAIASTGLTNLVVAVINMHWFRLRPFASYQVELLFYAPTDSSFPSNPVAITFAMATGVWFANRRLALLMYAVSLIFGLSRIYAGVFYPLDVIAGCFLGILVSILTHCILGRIEPIPTKLLRIARVFCLS